MLYLLQKPKLEDCFRLRNRLRGAALTYGEVGATRETAGPAGYRWSRMRIRIGTGEADFRRACDAIRQWKMLPTEIAVVWPEAAPIAVGQEVIVQLRSLGFSALGPCRIVYVVDEQLPEAARFGFAYGTLPGHLANGEERFLVEWTARDDAVWYELTAFSRPAKWWTWLTLPLLRAAQRNFAVRSAAVMKDAVLQTAVAEGQLHTAFAQIADVA
jgi:uncharacterized protein (UPF0548 family)